MKFIKSFAKRLGFDFVVNCIGSSMFTIKPVRMYLYRVAGIETDTNKIMKKCYFHSKKVKIGKGSFINSYSKLFSSVTDEGPITIGENCYLAMSVMLCTHTHEIGDTKQRAGKEEFFPIVIKDGCWLGANVTVLPGITIGEGCVIAAGSLVNNDCLPNGLYAGVPAKRIKDLV